jgi:hypothetical protein
MRSRDVRVGALALVLSFAAVACGDNPKPPPETPPAPTASATVDAPPISLIDAGTSQNVGAVPPVPKKEEKCIGGGAFDPAKGCIGAAFPLPDPFSGTPTGDLEKRFQAKKGLPDPTVQKEQVQIAGTIARRKAAGSADRLAWYKRAVESWQKFAPSGDKSAPTVDFAAEAEYALVEAELAHALPNESKKECPAKTGADLFGETKGGTTSKGKWQELALAANAADEKLEHIVKTYPSIPWIAIATAREGVLYANLHSILDACTDKNVELFTPKEKEMLEKLKTSGRQDLADKANEVTTAKAQGFLQKKVHELSGVDEVAFRKLALGIALANAVGASHDAITAAHREIAVIRAAIGDERAKEFLLAMPDPADPDHARTLAPYRDSLAGGAQK